MKVIIAYATLEGQTGKIARFAEAELTALGHEVEVYDVADAARWPTLEGADHVILAASVHERRHPKDFEVFVAARAEDLNMRHTMMISVSLSAAFAEGMAEAQDYVDEMKMRTELEPEKELLVAGAIRTGKYDYFAAQVVRHVVMRGRDFDPAAKEHEFTDWAALAHDISAFVKEPAALS